MKQNGRYENLFTQYDITSEQEARLRGLIDDARLKEVAVGPQGKEFRIMTPEADISFIFPGDLTIRRWTGIGQALGSIWQDESGGRHVTLYVRRGDRRLLVKRAKLLDLCQELEEVVTP